MSRYSHSRKMRINVEHLKYYNILELAASTLMFVVSNIHPLYDPYFWLMAAGVMVLALSYMTTSADYSRVLFTADPQRISMLENNKEGTVSIFPYIMDKRKLEIFAIGMCITVSSDYDLLKVVLNGESLTTLPDKDCVYYEIKKKIDQTSKFVIFYKKNETEVTSRSLDFTIFYNKKENSWLRRFRESHIID